MKKINPRTVKIQTFALLLTLIAHFLSKVNGQISTPCTSSMISNFTPCLNFITGSTAGGSAPSGGCCDALKSLMSNSMDCACLVVTASVPLPQIVNRTLALSLPRACNTPGVPVQCQASGSPLPAPGPVIFGAPSRAPAFSPRASKASTFAPAPAPAPTPRAKEPPSPVAASPVEMEAPSRAPRIRPVQTPRLSAASPSTLALPTILLIFIGFFAFKF